MTSSESSDSSESLEVDTDALSAAGTNFENLSSTVASIISNLTAETDALGTPWGNDSLGKKFADGSNGYLSAKDSLLGASGALPSYQSILNEYGSTVVSAADGFQHGEDAYGEAFIESLGSSGSST